MRTTAGPRRLPSVQSPTLRSKQAHTRSLLRLPALYPAPFSPTANRPSSSRNRPPHEATSPPLRPPFGAPHDHGEDAFTRFLQPTYDTSTLSDRSILESPPPAAFARGTASAASGPVETVSETRSSGARLTTSFQLRLRRELASRSPEQPAPFGPVGPDQGPSETTLPISPAAFSTARRGRDPASDVLCRDPPCTGRESRFEDHQDRFPRRLVQRTTVSPAQDACPWRLLANDCNQTFVREHDLGSPEPRQLARGCPRARSRAARQSLAARSRLGFTPAVGIRVVVPFAGHRPCDRFPAGATPAELHGSGARSTLGVAQAASLAIARGESGYPDPNSLGHLLSRARGDAGWRGRHTGR